MRWLGWLPILIAFFINRVLDIHLPLSLLTYAPAVVVSGIIAVALRPEDQAEDEEDPQASP